MIASLKDMLPAIETWPDQDQQALLEAAREIEAARTGVYVLTPEEERAVAEGLAQADHGEFATDEEIAALLRPRRK
jgi:predicted transcriptional regulator